jgi:hypothetical protein
MTLTEQRPDYDRTAPQGDSAAGQELLAVILHIFYPNGVIRMDIPYIFFALWHDRDGFRQI